jgi:hypothetical protein
MLARTRGRSSYLEKRDEACRLMSNKHGLRYDQAPGPASPLTIGTEIGGKAPAVFILYHHGIG